MDWDEEAMLQRFVWGYAHRFAMKLWMCGGRMLDPDDRGDYREVVKAIEFELGQGALEVLGSGAALWGLTSRGETPQGAHPEQTV